MYSDLHTHTVFSDGENTVEEMAAAAAGMGLVSLGFSDHSFTAFDTTYCMEQDQERAYLDKIRETAEAYAGTLEIYAGLELDGFSESVDRKAYDYVIGDCHYLRMPDGSYHTVDYSKEAQKDAADRFFSGNFNAYAKAYFETYTACAQLCRPDILGHFDLCAKFGNMREDDADYRRMAQDALEQCLRVTPYIEINTGAISRGMRRDFYPAPYLLPVLRSCGARLVLCGDAHRTDTICGHFDEAVRALSEAGFSSCYILKGGEFSETEFAAMRRLP